MTVKATPLVRYSATVARISSVIIYSY